MSSKARIRAATDRPDSSRKIRPTAVASIIWAPSARDIRERPDLDRHPDGPGDLRRPGERGVQVLGLDDVEAAEVLLRLDEGTVGGEYLAAGDAHDGGGVGLVQAAGEDPGARRLQLRLQGSHLFVRL